MSKYYVSFFDGLNHIALYEKMSDTFNNVLAMDEKINLQIQSIVSIDDCVVKIDRNKNQLILEGNDKGSSLVFKFADEILEREELSSIKEAIMRCGEKNGVIDITERIIINSSVSRNSKHNGRLVTYVTTFALAASIITGALSSSAPKEEIMPVEPASTYTTFVEHKPVIDLGNISPMSFETGGITKSSLTSKSSMDNQQGIVDYREVPFEDENKEKKLTHEADMSLYIDEFAGLKKGGKHKETEEPIVSNNGVSYATPVADHSTCVYLNFPDLSDSDVAIRAKELYYPIIEKYSRLYGLDPNLVLSIAITERGVHSDVKDAGGGIGLMQVQYGVWINQVINYYELDDSTGNYEKKSLTITDDMLRNVDTNIQIGCLILQNCLVSSHYNIPVAIQMYNMGIGTIYYKILDVYAASKGITRNDVLNNPSDMGWLSYRAGHAGDPTYLEDVNRFADLNCFTFIDVRNNNVISCEFTNENEELRHK